MPEYKEICINNLIFQYPASLIDKFHILGLLRKDEEDYYIIPDQTWQAADVIELLTASM